MNADRRLPRSVRVMVREGWDADAILSRRIYGRLAIAVREAMLAGESAEVIADRLFLGVDNVRGFIERLAPRYDIAGASLIRPRGRGKQARPARAPKLTPDLVVRLVRLRDRGVTIAELADVAGMSEPTVKRALRGIPRRYARQVVEWSSLRGPSYRDGTNTLARAEDFDDGQGDVVAPSAACPPPATGQDAAEDWGSVHGGGSAPKLSPGDIARLLELRAEGLSISELAEDLGVSAATVKRAIRGRE